MTRNETLGAVAAMFNEVVRVYASTTSWILSEGVFSQQERLYMIRQFAGMAEEFNGLLDALNEAMDKDTNGESVEIRDQLQQLYALALKDKTLALKFQTVFLQLLETRLSERRDLSAVKRLFEGWSPYDPPAL